MTAIDITTMIIYSTYFIKEEKKPMVEFISDNIGP
jgi:hypothetical protein